jgi:hypothetical protein
MAVEVSNDYGETFTAQPLPSIGTDPQEGYIEASGRDIAVVWNDRDPADDNLPKIIFSRSSDGGRTFTAPIILTPAGFQWVEPQMTVSPVTNALYMVWRGTGPTPQSTVAYYDKSDDFGATWQTPTLVDPDFTRERQVAVAAVDPNVYIAFLTEDPTNKGWSTQLRVSHDAAKTFGAGYSFGSTGLKGMLRTEEHAPRLWADGRFLSLVYDVGGGLFLSSSDTSGKTLGAAIALGGGFSALVARNTALWRGDDGSAQFALCR